MGHEAADAEDLVQGFVAHLLENRGLRLADRGRGRFRAFLLGSLKNYMANVWRRITGRNAAALRRHLSLDWRSAETGLGIEPPTCAVPICSTISTGP